MIPSLIAPFTALLTLGALGGIVLHDTRLDKAFTVAALPISSLQEGASRSPLHFNESHTHVERNAFSQAMRVYQTSTPGIHPRNEERKHLMQRSVPKGHHAFDNYTLPLV